MPSMIFANLRNILAELYKDGVGMLRVAHNAGLNTAHITLHPMPVNSWDTILDEADKTNKVEALLDVALSEHNENVQLRQAVHAYHTSIKQSDDSQIIPPPTKVNTSGGPYVAGDVSTNGGQFIGRDQAGGDIYNITTEHFAVYQSPKEVEISDKVPEPDNSGCNNKLIVIALGLFFILISSQEPNPNASKIIFPNMNPSPMDWSFINTVVPSTSISTTIAAAQTLTFEQKVREIAAAQKVREIAAAQTRTNTPIPPYLLLATTVITKTNPKDDAVYVWIPPGPFMMGASITDTLRSRQERPQHKVTLDGFWIMQTKVTNKQYSRCIEAHVCREPDNVRWSDPFYADHPVVNITWDFAKTYADWVGGRLLTEAEWEKACRGTDGRLYPWGNQEPSSRLLNYNRNKGDTTPVGSYPPGANELYDMMGNVWEFTADWYGANYYELSPERNPKGPDSGTMRTERGSAFFLDERESRCSSRYMGYQNFWTASTGFRVGSSDF